MIEIPLFLDPDLLKAGIEFYDTWNVNEVPHLLLYGPSGSGKTMAAKFILRNIWKFSPHSKCSVADYKGQDFAFCRGASRYFEFTKVADGIESFYQILVDRQSGNPCRDCHFLVIDEFAAFVSSLPKKEIENITAKIGILAMISRQYNLHLFLIQQTPYAEYFGKARDNFGLVIALSRGVLSKEAAAMFSFDRSQMKPTGRPGAGWMLMNGVQRPIQVPIIPDPGKLEKAIRRLVD